MITNEINEIYSKYIRNMKAKGYYNKNMMLKETSKKLLSVHCIKKGKYNPFLKIKCPMGNIMHICGLSQCDNLKDFMLNQNLYDIPYSFSIECFNEINEEISENCVIDIVKRNSLNEIEFIDSVYYEDICSYEYEIFKEKRFKYHFKKSIELHEEDWLIFSTTPNINITNIKLDAIIDMFSVP